MSLTEYELSREQRRTLVVDADLGPRAAFGTKIVPKDLRERHDAIRPHLRIVEVKYWGYDDLVHHGQMIVNKALVQDTIYGFVGMFNLRFPIFSVIPQSQFGYIDEVSMQANNSSNYRPSASGLHWLGGAKDFNPKDNPMDTTIDGVRKIIPAGAFYNPRVKGAIAKNSQVRRLWGHLGYEWGGGWGDPNTIPAIDFYQDLYFDYQHFQLNEFNRERLYIPTGLRG